MCSNEMQSQLKVERFREKVGSLFLFLFFERDLIGFRRERRERDQLTYGRDRERREGL